MNYPADTKSVALYVHVPWCVKKCPYCDFNSHALRQELPENPYIDALLRDLAAEVSAGSFECIDSIFIGGGTPSLLSGQAIARLLQGIRQQLVLSPNCEITLEANPGTLEAGRFKAFRRAGVNRLSLGIQSFDDALLARIGRIHDGHQARLAIADALGAGFDSINLDLMYGLPEQTPEQALADLDTAIQFDAAHISHYQLTIEPNTLFFRQPPPLPADDAVSEIFEQSAVRLEAAGYRRYEISAYARAGHQCRHNLNYWRFGDYLGIGAGAHGKLTPMGAGLPVRSIKQRHPRAYLEAAASANFDQSRTPCAADSLPLEFMMNALRLIDGIGLARFVETTSLPVAAIHSQLDIARERGLLRLTDDRIQPTGMGFQFLNELLLLFTPANEPVAKACAAPVASPAYETARRAVT